MNTAVLIPTFEPDTILMVIVSALSEAGVPKIVVVNDGSQSRFDPIFSEVQRIPRVTLLTHPENRGKGAALKTGFQYFLDNNGEEFCGVVTADADGQHNINNILEVAREMEKNLSGITLGVRCFDKNVPWKSFFGNTITRTIMRLFFGLKLTDTQTGLRGIPARFVPSFLSIPYNRYEFEMEMLMVCKRLRIPLIEYPIQTIYLDQNKASHFNPLLDSTRIYFMLFRYVLSSLITALTDYTVFIIVIGLSGHVLASILASRAVALIANYTLLRNKVFFSDQKISATFPKYALLVLASGLVSYTAIQLLTTRTHIRVLGAKAVVEGILFLFIFFLQKGFVFRGEVD